MGDRYNVHNQLEHLQAKYIGTGHADLITWEWLTNQHRDSISSYIGKYDIHNSLAIVENETKERVRMNLIKRMVQPCGPPPTRVEFD
ncbi:SF3b5 [Intoshia linei]|uniref:Splicing factor 3B subunit 5 n=1 Tax=Intoshia linei TaxID=1819745 RepID=A0A177B122_9BILA|nr:SF3b5 [Intoshia linei]